MKINNITKNNTSFTSLANNKLVLGGLEKIADHGASFVLAASFIGAVALRPFVISHTPKANKENKKYLSANSISSGIMKLAIAEAVALPVENAIKKINKKPDEFLNKKTIENFFNDKKSYNFLTQTIKQGTNLLTAIPKSCLTVALIPFIFDKFMNKKEQETKINPQMFKGNKTFSSFNKISFKGKIDNIIAKGVSQIVNNENIQNLSKKFSKNDTNITRNISVLTDSLLIGASVFQTKKSKKIKKEKKPLLICNNLLSGISSMVLGCALDNKIQKGTKKSIENFKNLHKSNPKLPKYIEGINILRPALIFALIYYGILPVVTTYLSDKFCNKENQ